MVRAGHEPKLSGALAAILVGGMSGGGSGGSDATPAAVDWTDANGDVFAFTNSQTISGINTPISLKVTWTGLGLVFVNDASGYFSISNGGTFVATNGDVVSFGVQNSGGAGVIGTVTITNLSDASTVLDTFNYDVTRVFV